MARLRICSGDALRHSLSARIWATLTWARGRGDARPPAGSPSKWFMPGQGIRWASGLLTLHLLLPCAEPEAQTVDQLPWGADPGGTVLAVTRSGDTIYLGGTFTQLSPLTGAGVPFDVDTGQPLPSYPRVAGHVYCVIPDGRGGWFIGGRFGGVGGAPRLNLAHILAGGQVAEWAPDPDGEIYALALSGDTLYVGGYYATIAGQARNNISAVDVVTGNATSWNPDADSWVRVILVRGRSVYIGGQFQSIGGRTRYVLAELDATTGTLSDWNPAPDAEVLTLAVSGDTLFAGGRFRNVAGTSRDYLAAISLTTGALLPWNAQVNRVPVFHYDGGARVSQLIADRGRLFVAGFYNRIGGTIRQGLAALSTDTGIATDWDPHAVRDVPITAFFNSMALDGNALFVGGDFDSLGGLPGRTAGAVDTHSGVALPWRPDPDHLITALAVHDGTLYAGGWFTSLGPRVPRHGLAALDARSGEVTVWDPAPNGAVEALDVRDGVVYVGGTFSTIGGQSRANVAAVDSATGLATDWNPSCNGSVWSLALTDSTVYVGGSFSAVSGQPRRNLAAIERASGLPTAWHPDPNDIVTTIAPHDSVIFAGGLFSTIGNATRLYAGAVDADSGWATDWVADASDYVRCIAVHDTTVYVGGYFNYIGGEGRDGIAAVSARTGIPTPWLANASREVKQVIVHQGVVYAAGAFSAIGGEPRDFIAALDLATGNVLDWNPGADGVVWALGAGGDRVYAGGAFQRMGPVPSGLIASIGLANASPPPAPPGGTGVVTGLSATNPADAGAVVRFTLSAAAEVGLEVFDLSGRRLARPIAGEFRRSGPHEIPLRTKEWPVGCYFYRLTAGGEALTRKILVVH